ncbi:MAG TPA: hypothetical protein DEA80_14445 [Afipia sp.]|nr:hypothetical protein [Afipia sp.]OUX62364.1 MAG: hypothetical protein CBB64_04455 [Afipia sp. TMED4]HAQ95453.1 hypothetical protein [Afipia sp.]HBF53294.1 hypothetical protein [Afipia sp.]HBR46100.1 hypothetical protein [Afipia sp.]|tara:strand:+ start:487 stop:672 length:186 start_codon:yes stop_codon:yes gene_type:complete
MKPPLILTVIASAIFIAVMFGFKNVARDAIAEYGAWIGFAFAAALVAVGFWIDSRRKPPNA